MNMGNNMKILVIGLDGGEWDVINPMIERGLLPNLQKMIASGVSGDLVSSIPPITPTAWASFLTGVNPGKHGIFSYQKKSGSENSYFVNPLNSLDIKTEHLWHILGRHGKKVAFVNVPMSFPPQQVNGYMITGMMTPSTESKFTFPDSLRNELSDHGIDYRIDLDIGKEVNLLEDPLFHENYFLKDKGERFFRELREVTDQRTDAIKYLMVNKQWDFFMGVFVGMDRVQHYLWQYLDDGLNGRLNPIAEKIFDYYSYLDKIIGEIILMIGDDTLTIIMSDHGFGKYKGDFLINRWLLDQGFLSVKKGNRVFVPCLKKISRKLGLRKEMLTRVMNQNKVDSLRMSMQQIDWGSSRAFSTLAHCIHINVKGRETLGCVEKGSEYENLRERITSELYKIKDPSTGKPVIKEVFKKEDVYSGSEFEVAPDLIVLSSDTDHYGIYSTRHSHDGIFAENTWKTGDHRQDGIFIVRGQGIKQKQTIKDARIIDVLPTILYAQNLPIPEYVDGKVLKEIFNDPSLEIQIETHFKEKSKDDTYKYREDEVEDIKDRLKQLGYID
jgi:predicted AlkP superfamily phosphohydrolase/phosphomutase